MDLVYLSIQLSMFHYVSIAACMFLLYLELYIYIYIYIYMCV